MKSVTVGCWPALLAVTFHLALLQLASSVTVRRSPPKTNPLGTLRAALTSRTEELHNQQNIAHGLQLEVRELQSEVQAERQALAKEAANSKVLELKLNRVRSVMNDDNDGNTAPKASPAVPSVVAPSSQRGGANAAQDRVPTATVEADPVVKTSVQSQISATLPVQTLEESLREVQAQKDTLDAADTELESTEDTATQQEQSTAPKVAPTLPPAPTQQLSQDQPPALKAATTLPQGIKPLAPARPARPAKPMAKLAVAPKSPTPQLRASASLSRPSAVVSDAVGSKGAEASADFDALEAQLHEEDRRIQDLDKENALDAMTDADAGGAPSALSVSNHMPVKAVLAQPKLELDSPEAPMEDFLNVEVPGPEPTGEAAMSTPLEALALPQVAESVGVGLDGALSDEKFLSQMATTARH